MTLAIFPAHDPATWDDLVRSLSGNVFHSSAWVPYIQHGQARTLPVRFVFRAPGDTVAGAALGFITRARFGLGTKLWFDSVPLVKEERDLLRPFLEVVQAFARKQGAHSCHIGSYGCTYGAQTLAQAGFELRPRLEFVLPLLGRDDDSLLAGLHHTKRQKIRSARKRGLAVREMSDPSGVECLLKLQRCSSRRIVARGGQDISYPGDARAHPVNLLLRDGTAKILVAFEGDEALSAVATTFFNGVAYDLLSGHSDRGFELQSGTFVIWSAMRRFRDLGGRQFNLGGCGGSAEQDDSPEHGLYVYKKNFGAEVIRCTSGSKVLRPFSYRLIGHLRRRLGRRPLDAAT